MAIRILMRFITLLAVAGLGLGCGGSALIGNDAEPGPDAGSSTSDAGGGTDGTRFAGADATTDGDSVAAATVGSDAQRLPDAGASVSDPGADTTGFAGVDATIDGDSSASSWVDGDTRPAPDAGSVASDADGAQEPGYAGVEGSTDDAPAGASTVDGNATSSAPCGPFTCGGGCCLPDGGCFISPPSAPPDIPCGSNGEVCATCASGESCLDGACQRDVGVTCTPANCAGCCLVADDGGGNVSTQCFTGQQDNFCGGGGGQCQRCSPATSGGHCVADSTGGHSEGAGQCNATNCAGCCSGALCVEGSQNIACGRNGVACQDCTGNGGACFSGPTRDGGQDLVCAYGCPGPEFNFGCKLYCSSPSDCVPGP